MTLFEQCEQTEHPEKPESVWGENAPNILNIKILLENLAGVTNSFLKWTQTQIKNHKNEQLKQTFPDRNFVTQRKRSTAKTYLVSNNKRNLPNNFELLNIEKVSGNGYDGKVDDITCDR